MQTIWNGGTLHLCDVTACKSEVRQPLGKTISLNNFDVSQSSQHAGPVERVDGQHFQ